MLPTSQGNSPDLSTFTSGDGYYKTSDGLIIQWITRNNASANEMSIIFPITFPHKCFTGVVSKGGLTSNWNAYNAATINKITNAGCNIVFNDWLGPNNAIYGLFIGF